MKVGILGSGAVAQALARGFIALGHSVKLGSRDPAKLKEAVLAAGASASAGTMEEAARFGELLVLATLWTGTESALQLAGKSAFAGKVVIDVTNPLDFSTGAARLALGHTNSGGETVQRWLPEARVVKAFNTVGNALMFKPMLEGGPPDMFICGNDEGARQQVAEICRGFGWGVVDLGGIEASRYLEAMCMVWVTHGVRSGTWHHAFKFVRK